MKISAAILFTQLLVVGCDDPSEEVTSATVAEPGSSTEATPDDGAQTTPLRFSNDGSSIEFIGSKVTASHAGSFNEFTGVLHHAESELTDSRVEITIQMSSLVADEARLTEHLKSDDFFDVEQYATASFRSSRIVAGGEANATHTVTGELAMHGQSREITFPATIQVSDQQIRTRAEFSINRSDWEITYPGMQNDLIREGVVLKLDIQVARPSIL